MYKTVSCLFLNYSLNFLIALKSSLRSEKSKNLQFELIFRERYAPNHSHLHPFTAISSYLLSVPSIYSHLAIFIHLYFHPSLSHLLLSIHSNQLSPAQAHSSSFFSRLMYFSHIPSTPKFCNQT